MLILITMRKLAVMLLIGCRSATPTGPSEQAAPDSGEPAVAEVEPEPEPPPQPLTEPVVNDASKAAHETAIRRYIRREPKVLPPMHGPPRDPNEPPGLFIPIANPPEGKALAKFHAALAEGRRVRVAMYGASGTAADMAVGYVRTYLQHRFGPGGPGFIPIAPLSKWYRHSEVRVSASKGWKKEHAQIRKGRQDGNYGLLGASFYTTKAKQWAEIKPKSTSTAASAVSTIELYFLAQPGGGSFALSVDGRAQGTVSTKAEEIGAGYHAVDVDSGAHSLRIETVGDGEVRMFGAVFEADGGGVVVDVLGIDGTRSENHLTWNEALWADNFGHRGYDLVTFSYGTNESVNEDRDMAKYREDLRTVITRVRRVAPDADCVLLSPVDFPIRDKELETLQARPQLDEIVEIQRELAPKLGCGFWDGVAFMGGKLSMQAWVENEPPLARKDYLHFTGRGSARKGQALCDALMLEYDASAGANR